MFFRGGEVQTDKNGCEIYWRKFKKWIRSSVLFEIMPRKVLRQKHGDYGKNKVILSHTETTVYWAYYTVTQFIQPQSFNLLVRSGKRLLNGWSHKIQVKSLKTKQLTEFTHFLLETGMGWTVRWDWEEFQKLTTSSRTGGWWGWRWDNEMIR